MKHPIIESTTIYYIVLIFDLFAELQRIYKSIKIGVILTHQLLSFLFNLSIVLTQFCLCGNLIRILANCLEEYARLLRVSVLLVKQLSRIDRINKDYNIFLKSNTNKKNRFLNTKLSLKNIALPILNQTFISTCLSIQSNEWINKKICNNELSRLRIQFI